MPMTATLTGAGAAIAVSRCCVSVSGAGSGCLARALRRVQLQFVRELAEESETLFEKDEKTAGADQFFLVSFRVETGLKPSRVE